MRYVLALVLMLCLAAFVACGGDDDDAPDATDPPAETPTVKVSAAVTTVTPGDSSTPTEAVPPTDLTTEMIDAVVQWVAENDFLGARREMTDPPVCDDSEDNPDHLGKVCIVNVPLTYEGDKVIVRAGIYRSDGVLDLILEPDGDKWKVVESRYSDAIDELTDEMVSAIAEYVAANDMFGERRVMTDPPRCGDTDYNNAEAYAGKVCVVEGTFTVTFNNVLVNAGLWASDAVLTMVLEKDGAGWTVVDTRDDFGN